MIKPCLVIFWIPSCLWTLPSLNGLVLFVNRLLILLIFASFQLTLEFCCVFVNISFDSCTTQLRFIQVFHLATNSHWFVWPLCRSIFLYFIQNTGIYYNIPTSILNKVPLNSCLILRASTILNRATTVMNFSIYFYLIYYLFY